MIGDMSKPRSKEGGLSSSSLIEFGSRLRQARLSAELSLAGLAAKLAVTKGYLSRLEHGKATPSGTMIDRIAAVMGMEPGPLRILAGHLPSDVRKILYDHPVTAPEMLREAFAEYVVERSPAQAIGSTEIPQASMTPRPPVPPAGHFLYELVLADCFDWMDGREPNSIHAIVTDPPYGLREYSATEKMKLRGGRGGVWRIPPSYDGCQRMPLPRFTVLTAQDRANLSDFFHAWAEKAARVLVPGGHVFIASNPLVSHLVYMALEQVGLEKRGEIIRLVQTLRGGDRPKNAHREFEDVTVMPRSCWEPWGLFRKPCENRVQDNLRKWGTGGLRRTSPDHPFCDIVKSAPTRGQERQIAPHPSLKPQGFMREIVRAALPLGEGVVLDPFMGAGSTIAAACAIGYHSIGIESDPEFYDMAVKGVPELAALAPNGASNGHTNSSPRRQMRLFDSQATAQ
jgi:site-specific DNA-methyltransferase (adenine-specific)